LGRRRLVGNSLAMLSNRLTQSIATFVLTAAIARSLGAEALGQYLLAFSYYFIFVGLVSDGSKPLFTRELTRAPQETPVFLLSGTLLQLLLSLVGYGVLLLLVIALPYNPETTVVCGVMGLALIPFSLSNITEAIFQAQERMHLIAISTVPIYLVRLLAMIGVMQAGFGVVAVCALFALSELVILLVQWGLILPTVKLKWTISAEFMWQLLLACRTFLLIGGIAIISNRIQILILSLLASEQLIGIYGGIVQLMQPFWIISNSLLLAVFPKLTKAIESGREHQRQIAETVIEILLGISLPFLVGLYFVGGDLLQLIFGSGFSEAELPLKVVAWVMLFLPFSRALSYVMVANGLERLNLIEVVVTTTFGGILGVILVSRYQLMGAAITDLAINVLGFCQFMFITQTRIFSLRLGKVFGRPLLISAGMALVFWLLQNSRLDFLLVLTAAVLAYGLLAGLIGAYAVGGQRLWARLSVRR
jgi:O-antigen/teichoic acid export membrane protein